MNATPSNPRSSRAPPNTVYLTNVVPRSGETATGIAYRRWDRKWGIKIGDVVQASVNMDSIFFAADVQCRLADGKNFDDERTLHEEETLKRLGKDRKLRPCVVRDIVTEAGGMTCYVLCPMASFHEEGGGARQPYNKLRQPASLLVRPVQTIDNNQTFGTYTPYQFEPEWNDGPQYLFPIQVSRTDHFVTNHWLPQIMDEDSFDRLLLDIEKVSNVWKRWRKAEHVAARSDKDIPLFRSEWGIRDWNDLSATQWKAYPSPSKETPRRRRAKRRKKYLELTRKTGFTQETNDRVPFKDPTDESTLSNTSEDGRTPLAEPGALLVQHDHTPSQTPTRPSQADFPASNSPRAPYDSKEVPDRHPAVTPKAGDKALQPSQHLLEDTVNTPHHNTSLLPSSDRIPVDAHIVSEVSEEELPILEGISSISSWKKKAPLKKAPVKRARSPEDEVSAADLPPKRRRTTQK